MALQITPQLEEKIDRMVSQGRYANASELVELAVELLTEYDEQLEALRAELQLGLDDIEQGREVEFTPELMARLISESENDARKGKLINDDIRP